MLKLLIILAITSFALFGFGDVFANNHPTIQKICDSRQLVEQGDPLSPHNFQGTATSPTKIKLTWCNPSTSVPIQEIRLTAISLTDNEIVLSKTLSPDNTTFIHSENLKADTEYSYSIIAIGTNAKSSSVSHTTVKTPSTPTTPPNFNLLIIVIGIIIAGGVGGFVFWNKHKNKKEDNDTESSNQQTLTEKDIVCSNCNTKNKDDVEFCQQCGNDLKKSKV